MCKIITMYRSVRIFAYGTYTLLAEIWAANYYYATLILLEQDDLADAEGIEDIGST